MKSVTSNFLVDQKKLVFTWKNPFEAIANNEELRYGEPYRATSRTFEAKPSKSSKNLFKLIHDKEPPSDELGNLVG